jgi:hypothetical protein
MAKHAEAVMTKYVWQHDLKGESVMDAFVESVWGGELSPAADESTEVRDQDAG